MQQLIYIADPMCSWCYGFGPQLEEFLDNLDHAQLDLVMGGLRAYNTEVMGDPLKNELRKHWASVKASSGLAFDEAILARNDFVYDTEPACRAVVVIRESGSGAVLDYFLALQNAFYRDGRDITQGDVLARVAEEIGFNRLAFREAWESDAIKEATRQDFELVQRWGVQGFPTLIAAHGDHLHLLCTGATPADVLKQRLDQMADH